MSERRRVVYLLLCHGFPHYLHLLFRALYRPDDHYVIHCDAKSAPALRVLARQLAGAFANVSCIEERLCSWGGYSLVDATLRGIDHALATLADWSHLVLLSEQHLPVHSADEIAARLEPGVSLVQGNPLGSMHAAAAADVRQRFAMTYRELPGVGSFAWQRGKTPEAVFARVHHGSQWVVLARDACARLRGRTRHPGIVAHLETSLLADETFLPTLLYGTTYGAGLALRSTVATYVAWPHRSGRPDMIFNATNFAAARDEGYLFIRKRPPELAPEVRHAVEAGAILAADTLDARLATIAAQTDRLAARIDPDTLAARLLDRLARRHPELGAMAAPGARSPAPRFFLRLHTAALDKELFVALLSEDMRYFKVVLVWYPQAGSHVPGLTHLDGYATSLMKVRVATLQYNCDVFLPDSPDQGFVTLDDPGEIDALADTAAFYLTAAGRLRPPTGATPS